MELYINSLCTTIRFLFHMIFKSIYNVAISVGFMQHVCAVTRYLQFYWLTSPRIWRAT